jgi:hypothetical protein
LPQTVLPEDIGLPTGFADKKASKIKAVEDAKIARLTAAQGLSTFILYYSLAHTRHIWFVSSNDIVGASQDSAQMRFPLVPQKQKSQPRRQQLLRRLLRRLALTHRQTCQMREAKAQRRRMRKRTGAQELTAGAEADLGAEDVPHRPNSLSNRLR